ncbi:hypothetical protein MKW98_008631 [Papaver atlanticum]|uniref:Uncharacterized protein n=1 Tax=Papaver atlanticum TaxID=357466 RepID=A0AAD4X8X3_9MAGN|nr:hypothetical protein MKW98_008631 [Papaver atlanticum]
MWINTRPGTVYSDLSRVRRRQKHSQSGSSSLKLLHDFKASSFKFPLVKVEFKKLKGRLSLEGCLWCTRRLGETLLKSGLTCACTYQSKYQGTRQSICTGVYSVCRLFPAGHF